MGMANRASRSDLDPMSRNGRLKKGSVAGAKSSQSSAIINAIAGWQIASAAGNVTAIGAGSFGGHV